MHAVDKIPTPPSLTDSLCMQIAIYAVFLLPDHRVNMCLEFAYAHIEIVECIEMFAILPGSLDNTRRNAKPLWSLSCRAYIYTYTIF